ncbi:hypothetical protein RIF29_36626 [Crotalaria pallida]|uniref:Uncharacterized protein n=1 Tax=Crotalaria pallida TaxID=3830 RepID=A0AAN9HUQ2_CROPI
MGYGHMGYVFVMEMKIKCEATTTARETTDGYSEGDDRWWRAISSRSPFFSVLTVALCVTVFSFSVEALNT